MHEKSGHLRDLIGWKFICILHFPFSRLASFSDESQRRMQQRIGLQGRRDAAGVFAYTEVMVPEGLLSLNLVLLERGFSRVEC